MEFCHECDWGFPTWRALQIHRYIKHGLVAQGKTQPDGLYIWECNKCEGNHNPNCDWCYGLDTTRIIEEMTKGARGQRYYALLKAFLSVNGKAMVEFAKTLRGEDGGYSPAGIGWVSIKFGLNFKATCEWLEETNVLRAGWYDRVMDVRIRTPDGKTKRLQVKDILDAARQRYE